MRRDLIALPDSSRVWIYQCDQFVSDDVAEQIQKALYDFTMVWQSHGMDVESYAQLFHKKFLVFVADESNLVSGCSIDSSVYLIKQLEQAYNLSFFDRLNFSYLQDDTVSVINSAQIKEAYDDGIINAETLMFDNLVNTKEAFINNWVIPLNESWYKRYLS
mgnify:CR=1 FL=1